MCPAAPLSVIPSQCAPRSKCPWGTHWRGNPFFRKEKRIAASLRAAKQVPLGYSSQ